MSRPARPWYRASTGWWMAWVDGKQVKLHQGPDNDRHEKQAEKRLRELLWLREMGRAGPDNRSALTVANVIDLYLTHAKLHLAERSYYERHLLLQEFAEEHG